MRIQEAHPLEQGLKQIEGVGYQELTDIRETHPLEQGLKQIEGVGYQELTDIQESHPLEQGLKPEELQGIGHSNAKVRLIGDPHLKGVGMVRRRKA